MSDTLTDAHINWTQTFTGLNLGGGDAPPAAAGGGPGGVILHGDEVPDKPQGKMEAPAEIMPPLLGPAQQKRAEAARAQLKPAEQKQLEHVMKAAKSDKERLYIQKGLASGHSVAELRTFAHEIAGKDDEWMQDHLGLTGDSHGKGVKQQWSMSCNATTVEAVLGQLDPIYALKMHKDNPNLSKADDSNAMALNPKMAADQKAMLETRYADGTEGGRAHNRGGPDPNQRGRWNTDLLNKNKASTGLTFTHKAVGTDVTVDQVVDELTADVQKGLPVPLVIGDGSPEHTNAHYVLVLATAAGPPRFFAIHDPASGDTEIRSEADMRSGNINLGGGWNKIGSYEKPTPVKVK